MKKMLDWLTSFIWVSEFIFLAASTPHIATYFAHFDNPTNLISTVYAWGVGYGLALLIDGVSFVVLMSMMFSVKYRRPIWLTILLVAAMTLVSTFSWFINWQYDLVFASTTFANADKVAVLGTTIGNLNPIIGGAFPFLSVLYALVAKAIEVDEGDVNKSAMSAEAFENEKTRIAQEQELKALKSAQRQGKGWLSIAQETVIGKSSDPQELLNRVLSYLQDARELLPIEQEERAVNMLVAHLQSKPKIVLPLLIQARSIIEREDLEESLRQSQIEKEQRLKQSQIELEESLRRARLAEQETLRAAQAEEEQRLRVAQAEREESLRRARFEEEQRLTRIQAEKEERIERLRLEHELRVAELQEERLKLEREAEEQRLRQKQQRVPKQREQTTHEELLDGMAGSDTVTLEVAAQVLGYENTRYVVRLRNEDTLKHIAKREDLITVASLRAYLATQKKRTPVTEKLKATSNGHAKQTIKLDEYPDILA